MLVASNRRMQQMLYDHARWMEQHHARHQETVRARYEEMHQRLQVLAVTREDSGETPRND